MRMLHRPPATGPTDSERLREQGADEITRRWLEAVRADRAIPSTGGAEGALILGAMPLVLDEILRATESDDTKIEHEEVCSAALHGRALARRHSDVRELVREYQLLRKHVFLYLREHLARFAGPGTDDGPAVYRRVGLALDEATRETLNAFVEERTGNLRHLSRTDSLTGLYNHRTFYERLDEELRRAARYRKPLSIVLIDLDDFKTVNDTNGHQFGDHLLVRCAELLRGGLRQTDVICRYGGDEFGVILPETGGEEAGTMMRRLAGAFKSLGAREGGPPSFGMSFGLSAHPEDDGTAAHLVQAADRRLLRYKRGQGGAARPVRPDGPRRTILVVEDYEDIRELFSMWFKKKGYRVLEAADGAAAVELARRERPDLITMDSSLPVLDGISATQRIRGMKELCDVPIIACSAHGTREWGEKALLAGCTDFITKPVDIGALEAAVNRHLPKEEHAG